MAKKRPTVLFLTPGASSVGGNIFLLNFLRWFKRNSDIPFVTVYGHGGGLAEAFAELGPAYQHGYDSGDLSSGKRIARFVQKKINWRERRLQSAISKHDVRLIYSNAVTNHEILETLTGLDVPVISHCHELESVIHRLGIEGFQLTRNRTDHFVAAAEAVKANLINNHAVSPETIEVIHEFIPVEEHSIGEIASFRSKIIHELGIPENAFVVGGSGTMYWRKAPDLFVQIAAKVRDLRPNDPIYFVWIGGAKKEDFVMFELNYDIAKLGLEHSVILVEHTDRPHEYFAAIDLFAMVSREDPFPLVCLESASLGKPVICFANAGGMPEFVADDCGFVVPYLDLEAFADRIVQLYDDRKIAQRLGMNAKEKVRNFHDVEIGGPKMMNVISKFIDS